MNSQCTFTSELSIVDVQSSSIELVVEGLINTDLSHPDQGLCSIYVHFNHDFVGDITITLQSPAGQEVTLVGPAVAASLPTQSVGWDVVFVQCQDDSEPDAPVFQQNFNTTDPWGNFITYDGSYYPHLGCLEDFDEGTATGIWTITATDVSQFGDGAIDYIELIFCDNTNVACIDCQANGGTLPTVEEVYCEGDPNLDLDLSPIYEDEDDEPGALHEYSYILYHDSIATDLLVDSDFSYLAFGDYLVCGLSYSALQQDDVESAIIQTHYESIQDSIDENNLCADIGSNCAFIHIVEVPDTIYNSTTICSGDSIVLNEIAYYDSGVYVASLSEENCDTISLLELTVIDNHAAIEADTNLITCLNPDVILSSTASIMGANGIRTWFTIDGNIESGTENDVDIIVSAEGTYGLSIITDNCADTAYITIISDESIPEFTIEADTITCTNPFVLVDLESSLPLESISWTGPLTADIEDIFIATGGVYYVSGITAQGCVGFDSITIIEDINLSIPTIQSDTITCDTDTVQIMTLTPDSLDFTFAWSGPGIVPGDELIASPLVTESGEYELDLFSIHNGCLETFSYEVLIDTNVLPVIANATTLDCQSIEANISASTEDTSAIFEWFNPDNSLIGITDTVVVSTGGWYEVLTTFNNGCITSDSVWVQQDTLVPDISIQGGLLTCIVDSIQLLTNSTFANLSYDWSGPINFESDIADPFVHNPGLYTVTVTDVTGCSNTEQVQIQTGLGLPNIIFQRKELNCYVTETTIIPSDTTNLIFDWLDNGETDTTSYELTINESGLYPVMVTDTTTGCRAEFEVEVIGNYDSPDILIDLDTINCLVPSITLLPEYFVVADSISWTNDTGYNSDLQTPVFNNGGVYYYYGRSDNGCVARDTFTIVENTNLPILSVSVPVLGCGIDEVEAVVSSSLDISSISTMQGMVEISSSSIFNIAEPGMYTSHVIAENFCLDSIQFEVFQDIQPPMVTVSDPIDITCLDLISSLTLDTDEPSLTYQWSGPSILNGMQSDSITLSEEGVYTAVVSDTANCETVVSTTVNSLVDYPAVSLSASIINCEVEQSNITLTLSDNIMSVVWDGPDEVPDDALSYTTNQVGEYSVIVTGDNNCITNDTIAVVIDTIPPTIDVSVSNIIDCTNTSAVLTATSSDSESEFLWTYNSDNIGQTESIEVFQSGEYSLQVTPPNACVVDRQITVLRDTMSPTIIVGPDPILNCIEGKVTLSIETDSNVISYMWDGPSGILTDEEPFVIQAGEYTVTVTNDIGCTSSAIINVIDSTQGPEVFVLDTFITCNLEPVPLPVYTDDLNVDYIWVGPDFTSEEISPLASNLGEYIVYAQSNSNNCVTIDTLQLTYQEVSPEFSFIPDTIDCFSEFATLEATEVADDLSAVWYDDTFSEISQNILETDVEGAYHLVVTGINGCVDTIDYQLEDIIEFPEISILLDEPFQCDNKEVTLNAVFDIDDEDYFVNWSTPNGIIIAGENTNDLLISGEGIYYLNVSYVRNGCESLDSIILVEEPQSLQGLVVESRDPYCLGYSDGQIRIDSIIGGFAPYTLFDGENFIITDSLLADLPVGNYDITVVDSVGCSVTTNIDLAEGLDFNVEAASDTLIIVGDTVTLSTKFNVTDNEISDIEWSADTYDFNCENCFTADVSPLLNSVFTVKATTINGCIDESDVIVSVNRNPSISVANVFYPGSSTDNDLFYIQQTSGIQLIESLSIYDRWADKVFHVENAIPGDRSYGWDGTFHGSRLNPGVFVVLAQLRLFSGEVVTYKGDLMLLR